jgi:hypothetical protein
MHKKFAKDGLVVISCCLDERGEAGAEDRALKVLRKFDMSFTNLLLDEPQEFWQEKLQAVAYPIQFVFNRDGRWKQFKDEIDHAAVERTVVEFLTTK